MPNIKLPDGKQISFSEAVSGIQIAEKISSSLSREALIMEVNGKLKDLNYMIENKRQLYIQNRHCRFQQIIKHYHD